MGLIIDIERVLNVFNVEVYLLMVKFRSLLWYLFDWFLIKSYLMIKLFFDIFCYVVLIFN